MAYFLYFHRLGTLLPGYSPEEIATFHGASDWHRILSDPIYAPYTIPVWFTTAVLHHGIIMTRIVAACFGMLAVVAFFSIAKLRYSYWIALLGTVLFATSAGLLHSARLGTGQILQMGIVGILCILTWYRTKRQHRTLIGYAVAAVFALMWYVPGMVWFELLGSILMWRGIAQIIRRTNVGHVAGWSLVFALLLVPLGYAVAKQPDLLLTVLGVPHELRTLTGFPVNLAHTIVAIGIRSFGTASEWLMHLPLLNAIEITLLAIGVYYRLYKERSLRAVFMGSATCIAVALASLSGAVDFACLIPLLYLYCAEGINKLTGQWLKTFPRNPIARTVGVVAICLVLSFSVLYQVRLYFVAWPHNSNTRQTFSRHP